MKKTIYLNMLVICLSGIIVTAVLAAIVSSLLFLLCAAFVCAFFIVLAHFVSKRLAIKIAAPINDMDLNDNNEYLYDELSPFLRKLSKQNDRINSQLEDLAERTTTIQTITRDMREGLILLDSNGLILSANDSAMRIFNVNIQEYLNRNILELTRRLDFLERVRAALNGEASDTTLEFASRIIQIFFDPVWHNNGIHGAILLFLDITEKANAEKLRREFTANVSHELKTPLTVISGLSEMIVLGMAREEDTREFANKIKSETERMIALVNDVLKLSELDENSEDKHFETFDLRLLAESAASRLSLLLREKNVNIDISGGDFDINANKNMVAELLFNLIENAIKYNVENGRIGVTLTKTESETKIEVSDTGIGVSEEHIPRMFERFYRVDKSRTKKTGGTGLGLSIVKHIALYHGGAAAIESVKGAGTKVTVTLKNSL